MPFTILFACQTCGKLAEFTAESDAEAWKMAEESGWRKNTTVDETGARHKQLMFPTCEHCPVLPRDIPS